jgi:predicted  nucleic acid-binding Zn-ribbon protein
MIYVCGNCRFVFERTGEICSCPDCGKPDIREASEEERGEYRKARAGNESPDNADARGFGNPAPQGFSAKSPL